VKGMSAAAESKTRPVRLDLPPDLYKQLSVVAGFREASMSSCARDLLRIILQEELKQLGVKL
jgi:hypothetical protein